MKKIVTLFAAFFGVFSGGAQCSVQAVVVDTACYCDGRAAAINPVGTPPFQYQWNFGDTTDTTSAALCGSLNYSVTMTDGAGCTATASIVIPGHVVIGSHNVSNTSCPTCCDGIDTANIITAGACPPILYQWSGDQFMTPNNIHQNLCAGTYTVVVMDQCGCGMNGLVTIFNGGNPNGIADDKDDEIDIRFSEEEIFIGAQTEIGTVEIFDLNGKRVYSSSPRTKSARIPRPDSKAPMIIKIRSDVKTWTKYLPPR